MNSRLRAFGRFLIFALLCASFVLKRRWLSVLLKGADDLSGYLIDHAIELIALLIFASVAARLEGRRFGDYGMPWRQALRSRFWQGAAAGIVALTVLILTLVATGALELHRPTAPSLQSAGFALAYGVIFVLIAVREEFLYRGYGQFTLGEAAGFWPAALVTTVWFTLTHVSPKENPIGLANVLLFGLLACLTLERTGALWLAIGFHTAWDWGETYLYGVADSGHAAAPGHLFSSQVSASSPVWLSGGAVGPEGSALCVALLLAIGLAYLRWGGRPKRA